MNKKNYILPFIILISFVIVLIVSNLSNFSFKQILLYSFTLAAIIVVISYEYSIINPSLNKKQLFVYLIILISNLMLAIVGVIIFSNINDKARFPTGVNYYAFQGLIVGVVCELMNKMIRFYFQAESKHPKKNGQRKKSVRHIKGGW
jgi:uncharacterized membrane protein